MGWGRNEPLWKNPHSWGSWVLTHMLSFSPMGETTGQVRVLLTLNCASLGGGVTWVKSNCSSYPHQCIQTQNSYFFLQWHVGSSPLETWTSAVSLIHGWLPESMFPWGFQTGWEGLELVCVSHQCPQLEPRFQLYYLMHGWVRLPDAYITWCMGGWDSSCVCWPRSVVLDPQLPQSHFYSTNSNEYLLVVVVVGKQHVELSANCPITYAWMKLI